MTGERQLGWYTGRTSPNTRDLITKEGGFIYNADDDKKLALIMAHPDLAGKAARCRIYKR